MHYSFTAYDSSALWTNHSPCLIISLSMLLPLFFPWSLNDEPTTQLMIKQLLQDHNMTFATFPSLSLLVSSAWVQEATPKQSFMHSIRTQHRWVLPSLHLQVRKSGCRLAVNTHHMPTHSQIYIAPISILLSKPVVNVYDQITVNPMHINLLDLLTMGSLSNSLLICKWTTSTALSSLITFITYSKKSTKFVRHCHAYLAQVSHSPPNKIVEKCKFIKAPTSYLISNCTCILINIRL